MQADAGMHVDIDDREPGRGPGMLRDPQRGPGSELIERQVAALLRELEAEIQRQVQVRVWRLPAAAAAAPAVLDRAAWTALAAGLGAPALAFVTGDDQQGHAWAGTQANAVVDLDVVQGRMDPIVSTLSAGLALDVAPLATRTGLRLDLRFEAAQGGESARPAVRDAADRVIAAIELPAQERDSLRGSVVVPDGGAAVLRFGDRAYAIQAELFQALPPP